MKSREDVLQLLRTGKPGLQQRFKLSRIALFGSYARGDQTENSDVDILVEVDPSIGLEFVSLAEEIEASLGIPVQLVSHRALNDRTRKHILLDLIDV